MTDTKKTEQQPEQAQPEKEAKPQEEAKPETTIVRTLVIQTDGNKVMIPKNEMGLLELAHVLQMLSAQVEREINQAAQPRQSAPAPAEPPDKAEEEQ